MEEQRQGTGGFFFSSNNKLIILQLQRSESKMGLHGQKSKREQGWFLWKALGENPSPFPFQYLETALVGGPFLHLQS